MPRCRAAPHLHAMLLTYVTIAALAVWSQTAHAQQIETMASCGTSMTITVTCLVRTTTQEVLDIRLENADGATSSVCDVDDIAGTSRMIYSLSPGDSIYGVQACYADGRLVGVTFSSAGGPLTCGRPQDPNARCLATTTSDPAPMASITGECNGQGIVRITRVCFNPFYVNPVIPVVGCPPGQGRSSAQEPCAPCPRNFYNPGGLQAECVPCSTGLVTVSEGARRCGCPPGFGSNPDTTNPSQPCAQCQPGTYYPGGNVEPCWRCRGSAFLTSPPGASSIVQCVCRPGYGAPSSAPNTCQPCPKGTWSNGLADAVPQDPLQSIVRFPPGVGNGKGKGGCYTCNPSWKECTPCCEASQRNCDLTTDFPMSTSPEDCRPPPPPPQS